jgi:2-methylcitrate dehydratase PrpD
MGNGNPQVSSIMREESAYIARALKRPLPKDVAEMGKHHLLDTLAAMVSGSRLLPGRKAIAYVRNLGGARQASVVGTRILTSTVNAAFANGMMAHVDETDDSHVLSLSHPGCRVVPAALAMGEYKRRDGKALLRAVVLGYDICARSNFALGSQQLRDTGHSSHSFGPLFGAAAAAGALAASSSTTL